MTVALETSGKPFVLDEKAFLSIKGVELNCITNKISLKAENTPVTSTTLCAVVDHPGPTKWTLGAILYQSFQDYGAYDVLSAAAFDAVPVPYVLRFHDGAAGPTNPEFTGTAVPVPATLVDSEAGALTTVEFTWGCEGAPMEDFGTGPVPYGSTASAKFAGGGNGARHAFEAASA